MFCCAFFSVTQTPISCVQTSEHPKKVHIAISNCLKNCNFADGFAFIILKILLIPAPNDMGYSFKSLKVCEEAPHPANTPRNFSFQSREHIFSTTGVTQIQSKPIPRSDARQLFPLGGQRAAIGYLGITPWFLEWVNVRKSFHLYSMNIISFGLSPFPVIVEMKVYRDSRS